MGGITEGIAELSGSLQQLGEGSLQLSQGSGTLLKGLQTSEKGSGDLTAASGSLIDAAGKLQNGSDQLLQGIGKADQKNEIEQVMDEIGADKDDQTARAFNRTFTLAAVILLAASVIGWFTDRRTNKIAS